MPRKSAASLKVVAIDTHEIRLRPPANLPPPERALFVELVSANPPNHFRPSDLPLLTQYCAASVLNEQSVVELRRAPMIDGKASPWLQVFEKTNRAVVALSMRLRLSPQARQPNNPKREQPLSAYEKMRLADVDDQ
jgi:phage terminase small subunit